MFVLATPKHRVPLANYVELLQACIEFCNEPFRFDSLRVRLLTSHASPITRLNKARPKEWVAKIFLCHGAAQSKSPAFAGLRLIIAPEHLQLHRT